MRAKGPSVLHPSRTPHVNKFNSVLLGYEQAMKPSCAAGKVGFFPELCNTSNVRQEDTIKNRPSRDSYISAKYCPILYIYIYINVFSLNISTDPS